MNEQSKPSRQPTPAGAEGPHDAAARARQLLNAIRRSDLSAPVHAIIGVSKRLLEDSTAQKIPGFPADIERIHRAACDMLEFLEAILHPEQLPQDRSDDGLEIMRSRVKHDVLNKLNPIINYSEMWLEDQKSLIEGFAPDLQLIYESGKRCLVLIDSIWRFPRPEDSEAATAQIDDMLPQLMDLIPPDQGHQERICGRVLVADDNEFNRDILQRHLETQGHTVLLAADGRQTLDIIGAEPVDVVLLDVLMPHVNGFEILVALKNNPDRRDLPVIMISAIEDIDIIARSIELGADDYLTKPFNSTVLQARITACLEKRHLREQEQIYLAQIQQERQRSDELLHVILPASIVADLKQTGTTTSRRYDQIGILFADITDFTPYCERHPPAQVVDTLQCLVEKWEEFAVKHHVQKIKTIGDAFMAACGLFEPVENPVLACIQCGQQMIEATLALGVGWNLRVGIDYGSAIGGVLGRRQYLFDLWGDTVNTASRMESRGVEGAVVVSDDAWRQVDTLFTATPHVRRIKGKGWMRLYRITGPIEPET